MTPSLTTSARRSRQPAPAMPLVRRPSSVVRGLLLIVLLWLPSLTQAQAFRYGEAPVRSVIEDIEAATAYRFLYRDAVVRGKRVTFTADSADVLARFDQALVPHRLRLDVRSDRRQVLVVERNGATPADVLAGVALDAEDGTRLPFATLSWQRDGRLRGVSADEGGAFRIATEAVPPEPFLLTATYVGYRAQSVRVDPADPPTALAFRLEPDEVQVPEVVVSSSLLLTDLDTTWHHLVGGGAVSPLGERSVQRAMQVLPAVSLTPALGSGLVVRGSRSDGFQVLLDGMTVYNQQHFFGLFDAFNEDALQTVGLYYGVAPASYPAPPGGTLSFLTKSGSQTQPRGSVGLSNSAVRGMADGPFGDGGSWLVAVRRSFVDRVDWFDNPALIAQGLDVGRETSAPGEQVFRPTDTAARFYDVHGKLAWETPGGDRLTASAYFGGDYTRVDTQLRRADLDQTFTTENEWGSETASVRYQTALGKRAFLRLLGGVSQYESGFRKDDFIYFDPSAQAGQKRKLNPYRHVNELTEVKAEARTDAVLAGGTLTAGGEVRAFRQVYGEVSRLHGTQAYRDTRRSAQLDVFAGFETAAAGWGTASVGVRSHYFSAGQFLRLSPRVALRFVPDRPLSFGLGYSRNHQFLHRLSLETATASDIWLLTDADEAPASVDHLTGGLYLRPRAGTFVQVEGYWKTYTNLRQHQLRLSKQRTDTNSFLLNPWLHDTESTARGLEVMLQQRLGAAAWMGAYTLSRVDIQHPALNRGQAFPAAWDRTHQFTSQLTVPFGPRLEATATWLYASGAVNDLAFIDPNEPVRLPAYHRLDLGVTYRRTLGPTDLDARFTLYNAYDRDNPWYRTPLVTLSPGQPDPRPSARNIDVYDLGLHPSFTVSLRF